MKTKEISKPAEQHRVKHTALSVIRAADGWEIYPTPDETLKNRLRRKRLTVCSNRMAAATMLMMAIWIIYGTILLLTN